MIFKGYNDSQKRNFLKYLNEYGLNLNYKEEKDIFKEAHKPENCLKYKEKK